MTDLRTNVDHNPDIHDNEFCELPNALRAASIQTLTRCAQPAEEKDGEPYLTFDVLPASGWEDLLELLDLYNAEHPLPEGYLDRAHTAEDENLRGAWTAQMHTERTDGMTLVTVQITMPERDLQPLRDALGWVANLPVVKGTPI